MDTLRQGGPLGQPSPTGSIQPALPAGGRPAAPGDDRDLKPPVTTPTPALDEALRLLAQGLWPVAIYPRGFTRRDGTVTQGKEPIGPAWGRYRWGVPELQEAFRRHPGAGVGVGLGPGRGPEGRWLADVEGDGPAAEASRARLFGGEVVASKGWRSTRGEHLLLTLDERRILEILPGLKSFETGEPGQPGVYKFADLPGLELRIGGYTEAEDQAVKQLQSVVPPTPGTNGQARAWTGEAAVAAAPESFYRTLAALAVRRPAEGAVPASAGDDPAGRGRVACAETPQAAWFRKVLEGESGKVALAPPGTRHGALLAAATTLGGHLHHGYFSEAEVVAALLQAAGTIPGNRTKDAATIKDGLAYGRARPIPWPGRLERPTAAAPSPSPSPNGADRRAGGEEAPAAGSILLAEGPQRRDSEGGFTGFAGSIPQIRPISVALRPVPPLDPKLIPKPLRAWLVDIAERACCPLDLPAISALVCLGAVVGRKLALRPKRQDDWTVVPNLWGMGILPPGRLKTHSLEEPKKALARLEVRAKKDFEEQVKAFEVTKKMADARAKGANKRLEDLFKKDDEKLTADQKAERERLGRELAESAIQDIDEMEPVQRRYIVNDTTIEKFQEILSENPLGLLLYRDELMGFFRTLERQGHEADRAFCLEGWNGTGSYTDQKNYLRFSK